MLLVKLAGIMFSDSIWKVPFCISYAAGRSLAQLGGAMGWPYVGALDLNGNLARGSHASQGLEII